MTNRNYVASMQYENYLTRATNVGYEVHGGKNSEIGLLMCLEQGQKPIGGFTRTKLLSMVKKRLGKATLEAIKSCKSPTTVSLLMTIGQKFDEASGADEILEICIDGMIILRT